MSQIISQIQSTDISSAKPVTSIKNLPINLFASVMGISGLVLAWRQATHQFGASPLVSESIGLIAIVVFLILSAAYLVKVFKYPQVVKGEFHHPIIGNFFGTVTIATLLISSVIAASNPVAAEIIWTVGALATIGLALIIVNRLLQGKIEPAYAMPAWIIPSVGTLDIPVTGNNMPMAWAHELNLLGLAIGSMLALVFFTMIMSRLIHQEKLTHNFVPSLMILIAPFEVGFLAYVNMTQHIDMFAGLLFYFGLFLFFAIAFKVFDRRIPFAAGWWAISFPLAALANAALAYAAHAHVWPLTVLAIALLVFLSIVILVLAIRTLHILANGKLLTV